MSYSVINQPKISIINKDYKIESVAGKIESKKAREMANEVPLNIHRFICSRGGNTGLLFADSRIIKG